MQIVCRIDNRKIQENNMDGLTVVTSTTNNGYQWFLPVFARALARTGQTRLHVMAVGGLGERVVEYTKEACGPQIALTWTDIRLENENPYVANVIRLVPPDEVFTSSSYVYITDVDLFPTCPLDDTLDYHRRVMREAKTLYSTFRSPKTRFRRPEISPGGWRGDFARLAAGTCMLKSGRWFEKTQRLISKYRSWIGRSRHDHVDHFVPGSYRENDEVILARMAKYAGNPVPAVVNTLPNGERFNTIYRGLHIGDFKFKTRRNDEDKMSDLIVRRTAKNAFKLWHDQDFQRIKSYCCTRSDMVRDMMHLAYKYIEEVV